LAAARVLCGSSARSAISEDIKGGVFDLSSFVEVSDSEGKTSPKIQFEGIGLRLV
jgi:hypothetical protein